MRSVVIGLLFFLLQIKVSSQDFSLQPITAKNAVNLEQVKRLGRGTANALNWHPDGKILAVASSTGVWLLDENLQIFKQTPIVQNISDLAWSPDGHHLAVGSDVPDMCDVQIWNSDFSELEFNTDYCGAEMQWSSDSKYLAVFNSNPYINDVNLIDVAKNQSTLLPGQDGVWSPKNDILFTRLGYTSSLPTLYTWDAATAKQLSTREIADDEFGTMYWGIDDHSIAIRCGDYNQDSTRLTVNLCNLDTRTGTITTIENIEEVFVGECSCTDNFTWNKDGTLLAYVNKVLRPGFLDSVLVLNKETNKTSYIGEGSVFDWKANSKLITTIVGNGELRTYDVATSTTTRQSKLFTSPINMIALRPNSQDIASSSFGYEQNTLIWNLKKGIFEPRLEFYVEPAETVFYSPDGKELIAGGTIGTDIVINQNVVSFDPDTGKYIRNIEGFYDQGASPPPRYWNANFTKFIGVNEDGSAVLPNGIQLPTHGRLKYVSWSPDEKTVATVEQEPNDYPFIVQTWDIASGQLINRYVSGMFAFRGLIWSPNSKQIAVILEHPTGSNVYVRGLRVFSVIKNKTYDFDQNDFELFEDVNIDTYHDLQTQADWNSDGTMIAVALSHSIGIYQLNDDKPLIIQPAYRIISLQWSKDDQFIAGGSDDGTIQIWGVKP